MCERQTCTCSQLQEMEAFYWRWLCCTEHCPTRLKTREVVKKLIAIKCWYVFFMGHWIFNIYFLFLFLPRSWKHRLLLPRPCSSVWSVLSTLPLCQCGALLTTGGVWARCTVDIESCFFRLRTRVLLNGSDLTVTFSGTLVCPHRCDVFIYSAI